MKLSKRLRAIKDFVTPGNRLADIGTDHAFIPIQLLLEGKIPSAIAMDLRKGPLSKAQKNIREQGLEDKIQLRLSDGMQKLCAGEADSILIAGMGADLMVDILKRGAALRGSVREYILSPHSEWEKLRRYLREKAYYIAREDMLQEEGKFYLLLQVLPGRPASFVKEELTAEKEEIYDLYGKYLIEHKHPVLRQYLEKERRDILQIEESLVSTEESERLLARKAFLRRQRERIEGILNEM